MPVQKSLAIRGVSVPLDRPFCDTDVEHLLHVFFNFLFVKSGWNCLLDKISSLAFEYLLKVAAVIEAIWFVQNEKSMGK